MVRSNLYERYDAGNSRARTAAPSPGPWIRDGRTLDTVPYEEWTTPEVVASIYRHSSPRSKLVAVVVLSALSSAVMSAFDGAGVEEAERTAAALRTGVRGSSSDFRSRNNADNADSHERSNPFAEEGHTSVMEGALERKRVGGRKKRAELEAEDARRRYGSKQESLDNVDWDRPPPLKGRQVVAAGAAPGEDLGDGVVPPPPPLELLNDTEVAEIFHWMNATDP